MEILLCSKGATNMAMKMNGYCLRRGGERIPTWSSHPLYSYTVEYCSNGIITIFERGNTCGHEKEWILPREGRRKACNIVGFRLPLFGINKSVQYCIDLS
jgi:hypothetical protein